MLTLLRDQMDLIPFSPGCDDILIVGGDLIVFLTSVCQVLFFDPHYHAYVISVTPQQSLFIDLKDHNVYHGHRVDGLTYITLKYCI